MENPGNCSQVSKMAARECNFYVELKKSDWMCSNVLVINIGNFKAAEWDSTILMSSKKSYLRQAILFQIVIFHITTVFGKFLKNVKPTRISSMSRKRFKNYAHCVDNIETTITGEGLKTQTVWIEQKIQEIPSVCKLS